MSVPMAGSYVDSSLTSYLRHICKIPILSQEEEIRLSRLWYYNQDIEAAHSLVSSHLKLVVKVAFQFKEYGLPLADLVSEGSIGLMKAVKKFNPTMECRLATYAVWWIKATIQDYILKSWSLVKLGGNALRQKLFCGLNAAKKRLQSFSVGLEKEEMRRITSNGTNIALQEGMFLPKASSGEANLAAHQSLSLNDVYCETCELIDFIPDTRLTQEESAIIAEDIELKRSALTTAWKQLSDRERDILTRRNLSQKTETLEQISGVHQISKERVRQIEERAISKLRSYIESANSIRNH